MKRILGLLLAAAALVCLPAAAQYTTASGAAVGGTGNLVASGTIYWQPVAAARIGTSSGQLLGVPYTATVTTGAFSITLPDALLATPNTCYAVTVIDNATGRTLLGAGMATDQLHVNTGGGYGCVQPTGSTWSFDAYMPSATYVTPPVTGGTITGPTTFNSSVTFGSTAVSMGGCVTGSYIKADGTGCGTPSGGGAGTVNSGSANQLAYYATGGSAVSGTNALPNGITATTQTAGDNSTKIATDAFVLSNAAGNPSLDSSIQVSPNCGALAGCYQVYDDGVITQTAVYPVVSGGATMTLGTSNDNDASVETGHVTSGPQYFTTSATQGTSNTYNVANSVVGLFKEASAGSGALGTCWGANEGGSGTTMTLSVTPAGGSGHDIIVYARDGNAHTSITFSDPTNGTYTNVLASPLAQLVMPHAGSIQAYPTPSGQMAYFISPAAGTYTITANFGTSVSGSSMFACEVSGLAAASNFDAGAGHAEFGSPIAVNATATTNDFAFVAATTGSTTATFTAGNNGSSLDVTTDSSDFSFKSAQVGGKVVASTISQGNNFVDGLQSFPSGTTVTAYVSAHHISVSKLPDIASRVVGSTVIQTGPFVVGHDDGAQLAAAWATAIATPNATLNLPCGTMLVGTPPFIATYNGSSYNPNLRGCQATNFGTVLVPTEDFNYGAASGAIIYNNTANGHGGNASNWQNGAMSGSISDITIFGGGVDGTSVATALPIINTNLSQITHVWVNGWDWNNNAGSNNMPAIQCQGCVLNSSGAWSGGDSTLKILSNDNFTLQTNFCFYCYFGVQYGFAGFSGLQSPSAGLYLSSSLSSTGSVQFTSVGSSFIAARSSDSGSSAASGAVVSGNVIWHSQGDVIASLYATGGTIYLDGSFDRLISDLGITNAGATIYARGTQIDKLTQSSGAFYDRGGNVACTDSSTEYVCFDGSEVPWWNHATFAVTGGTLKGNGMADFTFSAAGTPLPACSAIYLDAQAQVSDATSPTYLGTYTSGGAVHASVQCNGTNWVTH